MIDNAQPIDYLQLYAQAVAALNNNERYWLTHEEEVSQMQANEAFQQRPLFEDLFFQYYRPASHKEEGLKISAGEIYLSLQKERRKTSDEQCLRLWSLLEKDRANDTVGE